MSEESTSRSRGTAQDECGHPNSYMDLECVCHCSRCADPRIERGAPGYCICPQCTICRSVAPQ